MPKNLTAAMRAHLDAETTRLAAIWRITRKDGALFFFTDHDRDIAFGGDTVHAVQVTMVARKDDAEARQVRTKLKSGTTTAARSQSAGRHQHEVGLDGPERVAESQLGGAGAVVLQDEVMDQALLDPEHGVRG
jgi:hypothetical protein